MKWGKTKENGIWIAPNTARKFQFRNHDSLYIAVWRLRVRLMKPWVK